MPLLPRTPALHVGIEIECVSPTHSMTGVNQVIRTKGLGAILECGTDSSIVPCDNQAVAELTNSSYNEAFDDTYAEQRNDHGLEIRFCSPIEALPQTLAALKELLITIGARANMSCGLHVHLDAREVFKIDILRNLFKHQRDLYNAVAPDRRTSEFCEIINTVPDLRQMLNGDTSHYHGISGDPEHTVEVRMHHGTVDVQNEIGPWVRILTTLAFDGEITTRQKQMLERRAEKYGNANMENIPNLTYLPASGLFHNSLRPTSRRRT